MLPNHYKIFLRLYYYCTLTKTNRLPRRMLFARAKFHQNLGTRVKQNSGFLNECVI